LASRHMYKTRALWLCTL